jgi:hypothetical protein
MNGAFPFRKQTGLKPFWRRPDIRQVVLRAPWAAQMLSRQNIGLKGAARVGDRRTAGSDIRRSRQTPRVSADFSFLGFQQYCNQ